MAKEAKDRRNRESLEHHLKLLREDCTRVDGKPFDHFLCPILLADERVELCMGHIINEAIPNTFRACVLQRKDVDNFFGSMAEGEFTTKMQSLSMTPTDVLLDPEMSKKVSVKMMVGGEEWRLYPDRGTKARLHSWIIGHLEERKTIRWVVKKSSEEIRAVQDRPIELEIGKDCRLSALISLIKAAHLTLFKLLGYSYALSAAGMEIGYSTLGRFYRDHGDKKPGKARSEAPEYFRPYVNIMRTIDKFTDYAPRGTIQDHRAQVCFTSSGNPFGISVWIRADSRYYAVLMPAFSEPDGAAAYIDFLRNNKQSLRMHTCQFENMGLVVSERWTEIVWPKGDLTFDFD